MDASVLNAHLNSADTHHEAANEILINGAPGQMVVHSITLAEVLVGGVRIGQGASMFEDLRRVGLSTPAYEDGEALRLAELRVRSGLKMPDCCVLDAALRLPATVATFDAALARAANKLGLDVISG